MEYQQIENQFIIYERNKNKNTCSIIDINDIIANRAANLLIKKGYKCTIGKSIETESIYICIRGLYKSIRISNHFSPSNNHICKVYPGYNKEGYYNIYECMKKINTHLKILFNNN